MKSYAGARYLGRPSRAPRRIEPLQVPSIVVSERTVRTVTAVVGSIALLDALFGTPARKPRRRRAVRS